MIRAVATDSESGDEFSLVADDQFVTRQSKIGYYGSLEEGRMIIDDRVLTWSYRLILNELTFYKRSTSGNWGGFFI